jgi:hypothetical protein
VEGERAGGFVAGHEGDVLEFAEIVGNLDVFANTISFVVLVVCAIVFISGDGRQAGGAYMFSFPVM